MVLVCCGPSYIRRFPPLNPQKGDRFCGFIKAWGNSKARRLFGNLDPSSGWSLFVAVPINIHIVAVFLKYGESRSVLLTIGYDSYEAKFRLSLASLMVS